MVKDKLKIINSDGHEAVDGFKTGYIDAAHLLRDALGALAW